MLTSLSSKRPCAEHSSIEEVRKSSIVYLLVIKLPQVDKREHDHWLIERIGLLSIHKNNEITLELKKV